MTATSTGTIRRAMLVLAAALVLASVLPRSGAAQPEPAGAGAEDGIALRVFALAYRHETGRVTDYETFRTSVRELVAREVTPHLAPDRPNLVTFPENQSLMAYAIGARGAAARALLDGGADAAVGLASLAAPYEPQIDYYAAQYPGVDSPGQLLQLALTDTLVRVIVETFGALAEDLGAWVAVSSNLAPFTVIDGQEAALLADPQSTGGTAYVATDSEVRNRNLVFSPAGELVAIQDKSFLVPIERTRDLGLGLYGIEVGDLPVADLPIGQIGTVISKDAWMPAVNDRLEQLGAQLVIQSEAFSTWGSAGDDLWPPDKFQRGGWWMVQKHPGLEVNVTPMLTGNLGGDLTFDGQPLVAVEAHRTRVDRCLAGQDPEPGWAAVGPWAVDDEPDDLCDPALRPELADVAAALAPGSGDPRENAYADTGAYADVVLNPRPAARPRVPFGAAAAASVAVGGEATQLLPDLEAEGDRAALTWVGYSRQDVATVQATVLTVPAVGELATVPASTAIAPREPTRYDHFDDQWGPSVAWTGDGALVSYTAFPTENWDLFAATVDAPNDEFRVDDAEQAEGVTRERGHADPELVALPDGSIMAVWSDLRWPWIKPQVRRSLSTDGGRTWSPSVRVDGGPVVAEEEQLDARDPNETRGQAFPAVAVGAGGRVDVAWQEHDGAGVAAIWLVTSTDGGQTFGRPRRLSGPQPSYRPALTHTDRGLVAAWEQRASAGHTRVVVGPVPTSGTPTVVSATVDDPPQRWPELVATREGALVVFEDARAGDADILAVRVSPDGGVSAPIRVDDAPDGIDAWAPAAAVTEDGRVLVAWQDRRSGDDRLRLTTLRPDEDAPSVPALPATGGGLAVPGFAAVAALGAALLTRPAIGARRRTRRSRRP